MYDPKEGMPLLPTIWSVEEGFIDFITFQWGREEAELNSAERMRYKLECEEYNRYMTKKHGDMYVRPPERD